MLAARTHLFRAWMKFAARSSGAVPELGTMEITTFEFAPVGVSPPSDGMYLRRRGAASVPAASGLLGAPLVHIPCTPKTTTPRLGGTGAVVLREGEEEDGADRAAKARARAEERARRRAAPPGWRCK